MTKIRSLEIIFLICFFALIQRATSVTNTVATTVDRVL